MKQFNKAALLSLVVASGIFTARGQVHLPTLGLPKMGLPHVAITQRLDLQRVNLLPIEEAVQLPPSCFQVNNPCGVVPVQLLEFTAERANDQFADVKWTTESEAALRGYYIERSLLPAAGFETRGFVAATQVNTIKKEYAFTDANDFTVISYYRLRMADMDGAVKYSEVRPVKPVKAGTALLVYPNPATVQANLRVTVSRQTAAVITWSDAAGKKIKEQQLVLQPGANYLAEDVSSLAGGSYFITVVTKDGAKMRASFFKLTQ